MSRTKVISVRIPITLLEKLETVASKLNVHRNDLILEGIKIVVESLSGKATNVNQINTKRGALKRPQTPVPPQAPDLRSILGV